MRNNILYLTDLLDQVAAQLPDSVAVKDRHTACSYRELVAAAHWLAGGIRGCGVQTGDRVALLTRKDVFSIQAFFGIILSGGIPVLLDEEEGYAINRDKLRTALPAYIILNKTTVAETQDWGDYKLITATQLLTAATPVDLPGITPAEICYMLTTSGTTGAPKVIQVSHSNILHYIFGCYEALARPERVHAAHVTNLATDLGFTNIAMALVSGGMLRLFDAMEAKDPDTFKTIIREEGINFIKTTPSHIHALLPFWGGGAPLSVGCLVLGGEKLPWSLVQQLRKTGICDRLFNHYGPSETTVGALVYPVTAPDQYSGSVPIGRPIGSGRAYLTDIREGSGELLIEGPGVSGSYFNNEQESEARFFFNENSGQQGYRTGDICQLLDDGNFVFLNRNDRQIKVKGYRVELDEIEGTINTHPQVDYARINTFEHEDKTILEVYIKPLEPAIPGKKALVTWLKERLAFYKIPERIYISNDCPYKANGKIDFPALRARHTDSPKQGPQSVDWSDWESSVHYCWQDVLGELNAGQHFFESGGDSLGAIRVVGKLQMYVFDVSMADLNNYPVLEDFVGLQKSKKRDTTDTQEEGNMPWLTRSQFDFFRAGNQAPDKYVQTLLCAIEGDADIVLLSRAIRETIHTHNELNQKFILVADDVYTEPASHPAPVVKIYHLDPDHTAVNQILHITGDIVDSISLERGVTFLAAVIKNETRQQFLFLACHHIVVDALSWTIILDEILTRYDHIKAGQATRLLRDNIRGQFYHRLPGTMPVHLAPPSGITGIIKPLPLADRYVTPETSVVAIPFSPEQSAAIKDIERRTGKEERINNVLLACFLDALFGFYEADILSVDIEFHGRPQVAGAVDLSRSVSWWSTTFPVDFRSNQCSAKAIGDYLAPIADYANTINAYPGIYTRQEYVKSDVRFNYLGEFPDAFGNASISLIPSAIASAPTRSDLYSREYKLFFTARFIGEELMVDLQYCKGIIAREHVNRIAERFVRNLLEKAGQAALPGRVPFYPGNIGSVGKPLFRVGQAAPAGPGGKLLLTGATGFLGAHVLHELLLEAQTVVCLVRGQEQQHAFARLKDTLDHYFPGEELHLRANLEVIAGDLGLSRFGLDQEVYTTLSRTVTVIVHSAADVNLTKSYANLQETNIFGTEQVLDFTLDGSPKVLHYASTLAVSGAVTGSQQRFSEIDFNIGQTFLSEYERSKFEAEQRVRAKMKEGLQAKIYRFGHIAAHSVTGRFQKNAADNRIIQLLKGVLQLRKVPQAYNEKISFSHVDIVAKMMAAVVMQKLDATPDCLHLENATYYSIRDILSRMEQIGYASEIVPDGKFNEEIIHFEGSDEAVEAIHALSIWINRHAAQKRNVRYESRVSNDLFGNYSLVFPALNNEWLERFINDTLLPVVPERSETFNFVGLDK